jgi:DHA2 family methylenomycin A resistance protein-like MFS transporter
VPVALAGLLVLGVAGALVVTALNTVVAITSPPDLVGVATALLNASRQVGGVLGIAILGALVGGGRDQGGVDLALVVAAAGSFVALVAGWVLVRAGPAREGAAPDDVCAEVSS